VTSGYCPRYRYTLIATLTLDNLYYICVCIFFQHTPSEKVCYSCALSAGILRRYFIRRSFSCGSVVRSCGSFVGSFFGVPLVRELYVGSFFRGNRRSCASVGSYSCVIRARLARESFVARSLRVRWVIFFISCGSFALARFIRWLYVGVALPSLFHVYLDSMQEPYWILLGS
jgi:hypothetical protein